MSIKTWLKRMSHLRKGGTPEVLNMEITFAAESHYRIGIGSRIKYVIVAKGSLSCVDFIEPLSLFPPLPWDDDSWTTAYLSRKTADGPLKAKLMSDPLPAVEDLWHPVKVDCFELRAADSFISPTTVECVLPEDESETDGEHTDAKAAKTKRPTAGAMIAKIARFEWEVSHVARETHVYELLEGTGIAPRFLGHIHENGRVMGFLLEKIEGRSAEIRDLEACREVVRRFHEATGMVHGTIHRCNFLVDKNGRVYLIDFGLAEETGDEVFKRREMKKIKTRLEDTTPWYGIDEESDCYIINR